MGKSGIKIPLLKRPLAEVESVWPSAAGSLVRDCGGKTTTSQREVRGPTGRASRGVAAAELR